jgi:tetratricopeptide (TPR) repeat protein
MKKSTCILLFTFITVLFPLELFPQYLQKVDSLQTLLEVATDTHDKVDILNALSDELIDNSPEKALVYANESNDISCRINYIKGEIISRNNLALIYLNKVDLKTAVEYAEKAKLLSEKAGMQDKMISSLLILGRIYNLLCIYDKSSEYLFEALKISEEIEDKEIIAKTLNTIGYVHYDQANYEKALAFFQKALNIYKEINNLFGIAFTYNNVGAVYLNQQKYDLLERNVRLSLKLSKKLGNLKLIGTNYLNLGQYFENIRNTDSAMFYYQKALSIFKEQKSIDLISGANIYIAHTYLKEQEYEQSLKYATEALDEGQEYGLKKTIFYAAELLSNIYTEKKEYKNANEYLLLFYNIKDSLNLDNKLSELSKMEMIYKWEKEGQIRKSKEQRKNLRFIIITISLVFIFTLIIIIIFNRNRIKTKNALFEKKILENDLELKTKIMTSNVMSLMKKNEILLEISKKLNKVEKGAYREETKEAVRKIAKEIQKNTSKEIWKEFKVRFEEVHKDFYGSLLQKYPDLWPSELRLCAFLKLNMTNKEISELTGQSIAALEKARYRLRKKMGLLNTEANLITFLSRF